LSPNLLFFSLDGVTDCADAIKLDNDMTPRQIVDYLNKHIVGQQDAKRAIAIAMVWPYTMLFIAN
jgi:ATP-dependent protease Clp ATPase subunit